MSARRRRRPAKERPRAAGLINPQAEQTDRRASRPTVAIFGAGIAGLTAAHELIERGFGVWVFDPAPPAGSAEQSDETPAIGGMARTQWDA